MKELILVWNLNAEKLNIGDLKARNQNGEKLNVGKLNAEKLRRRAPCQGETHFKGLRSVMKF